MVSRVGGWGEENRELLFNEYKFSVLEDKKSYGVG